MSFENPQILSNSGDKEEKSELSKVDKLKRWTKRGAALTGLSAALLSAEGCDSKDVDKSPQQTGNNVIQVDKGSGRSRIREQYETGQKAVNETIPKIFAHETDIKEGKITERNIENDLFLKSYYEYVGKRGYVSSDGGNQVVKDVNWRVFEEGAKMRALWHAWLNGIKIDLSKGLSLKGNYSGNYVLVSAELNGVKIPINEGDFTEIEKKALSDESVARDNVKISPTNSTAEKIKTSPDFDKNADF